MYTDMDIKIATEGIVSNPSIISYSLMGITTLVLGYFTFFDDNKEEGESSTDMFDKEDEDSEGSKEGESSSFAQDITQPVSNLMDTVSEKVEDLNVVSDAEPKQGGKRQKKTRGRRRNKNRSRRQH